MLMGLDFLNLNNSKAVFLFHWKGILAPLDIFIVWYINLTIGLHHFCPIWFIPFLIDADGMESFSNEIKFNLQ
jgi:hypothetical protein